MRFAFVALSLFTALPLTAQERVPTAQDSVRGNLAVARSDLRNLVVAQEAFFAGNSRYTASLDSARFTPSRGSRIQFTVTRANGWAAVLTRERLSGNCVIWIGLPPADRPKTANEGSTPAEGEPRCDPQPELAQPAATPPLVRPPR